MPAKECPASTVGPSCRDSTRLVSATASSSVVSGFWTEVAFSPAACRRGMTSDQDEPSAKSPCTRTTFRAAGLLPARASVGISVAVSEAASMDVNVRRLIIRTIPSSGECRARSAAVPVTPRPAPAIHRVVVGAFLLQSEPLILLILPVTAHVQAVTTGGIRKRHRTLPRCPPATSASVAAAIGARRPSPACRRAACGTRPRRARARRIGWPPPASWRTRSHSQESVPRHRVFHLADLPLTSSRSSRFASPVV